jgi:hypothetical protein
MYHAHGWKAATFWILPRLTREGFYSTSTWPPKLQCECVLCVVVCNHTEDPTSMAPSMGAMKPSEGVACSRAREWTLT